VEGYNVISAQNGRQALELLNATPPDLILLDITIPGGGQQAAQMIAAAYPIINIAHRSPQGVCSN
jgi:CheY-like chemotaxis protein